MRFPDRDEIFSFLEPVEFPRFARVSYDPATPHVDDVRDATGAAVTELPLDLPEGARIAVAVGSRGIHDIAAITDTVVDRLQARGYDPVIVPAMGSHGGATPDGQRAVLAELGITPERLGCPIDARMDTAVVGRTRVDGDGFDVHLARAALEADAILPINRIKPHTAFSDRIESGVCKLVVVGLGKQGGARVVHRQATRHGFEPIIAAALRVIRHAVTLPGGIGIVENFYDRTARVASVPGDRLIEAEASLLELARQSLATIPFDAIDLLVVDEIGKDVSGTGMDTNVIGRTETLAGAPRDAPEISRIYVRGLTDGTHGNANGVGLADLVHRDVIPVLDLEATYANVLTSGLLGNAALPPVMPDDETALTAAVGSLGAIDPADLRIVWITQTGTLDAFRISSELTRGSTPSDMTIDGWDRLDFEDGQATFRTTDPP